MTMTDDRLTGEPGADDGFTRAFGEPLRRILDLDTWGTGDDLTALYRRLEEEVGVALREEDRVRAAVRAVVLPKLAGLAHRPQAPRDPGVFQVTANQIAAIHRGLLFTGAVEACDGAVAMIDTVPVTIAQIGVGLVSYRGDLGAWVQRLYRRDLTIGDDDDLETAVAALLDARERRGGVGQERGRDVLTRFAQRGLMDYAERAALAYRSTARWRIGHGGPAPVELLTGAGAPELALAALDVLDDLITKHRRFLFVPSEPSARALLTIGDALGPLEFAVVLTAQQQLSDVLGRSSALTPALTRRLNDWVNTVGPTIGVGVYRAAAAAPPHIFYSHVDHMHAAGALAIADSVLLEHRGFPLLIDLAESICRGAFGAETFGAATRAAYAAHGAPYRYWSERQSRAL